MDPEIIQTRGNLVTILDEKSSKFVSRAEIVVISISPGYKISEGEIVKFNKINQFRFSAGAEDLDKHIDFLLVMRDNLKVAAEMSERTKVQLTPKKE